MTGFQPLIVSAGQAEQVGNRRTEILRLNLGPPETVVATGDFSITRTAVYVSAAGNPQVKNIYGGQTGDVLILSSNGIKLRSGGNLALTSNMNLGGNDVIAFYWTGSTWWELWRNS